MKPVILEHRVLVEDKIQIPYCLVIPKETIERMITSTRLSKYGDILTVKDFMPEYLKFNLKGYPKLATVSQKCYKDFKELTYKFLSALTDDDIAEYINMLYMSKLVMEFLVRNKLDQTVEPNPEQISIAFNSAAINIGIIVSRFFQIDNIKNSVLGLANTFSFPSKLNKVGTRAQDSEELTYYHRHYRRIYRMYVIFKIIILILSDFNLLFDKYKIDEINKILITLKLYEHIFKLDYLKNIVNKLKLSIQNVNRTKSHNRTLLTFKGITPQLMNDSDLYMTVKKLLNIEACEITGEFNIISKIYSQIRNNASGGSSGSFPKVDLQKELNQVDLDEDSKFEVDHTSFNYKEPISKAVIYKLILEELETKVLKSSKISRQQYADMCQFYNESYVTVNIFNNYIISALFYDEFGGYRSIITFPKLDHNKMLVLAQLELLRKNVDPQILHFLTAIRSKQLKEIQNMIDANLNVNYFSKEGTELISYFNHIDHGNTNEWGIIFENIRDMLANYNWIYNTAPDLYTMLDTEDMNGLTFKYDNMFLQHILRLTLTTLQERRERYRQEYEIKKLKRKEKEEDEIYKR